LILTMSITAHTLATAVSPHIYWITSRAAGIVGLLLSSISVCVGLLMGGRLLKGRQPDLRVTHEALSLATLGALAVHGLTLIGDGFLHPSLGDVAVPFLSGYKTLWTGTGIVAFWALARRGNGRWSGMVPGDDGHRRGAPDRAAAVALAEPLDGAPGARRPVSSTSGELDGRARTATSQARSRELRHAQPTLGPTQPQSRSE
jgi:hypothetical protein